MPRSRIERTHTCLRLLRVIYAPMPIELCSPFPYPPEENGVGLDRRLNSIEHPVLLASNKEAAFLLPNSIFPFRARNFIHAIFLSFPFFSCSTFRLLNLGRKKGTPNNPSPILTIRMKELGGSWRKVVLVSARAVRSSRSRRISKNGSDERRAHEYP